MTWLVILHLIGAKRIQRYKKEATEINVFPDFPPLQKNDLAPKATLPLSGH